jgi:hypothetical protein
VTQHGSFPGRPRGRRARHEGDGPEWQGNDATPEDQREFPDLPPIRPREARPRDGQAPPGRQPGRPAQPGGYGGYQGGPGQGYQQGQQGGQPDGGYGGPGPQAAQGGQYGGGYQGGGYGAQPGGYPGGPSGAGAGAAPWEDQAWPGQQPDQGQPAGPGPRTAQQDMPYPPESPQADEPRPGRRARRRPADESPSWAEPDSEEAFSERWHRRGLDTREDRRSGRRNRRRLLIAGGVAVAMAIAAAIYLFSGGPGAASLGFGNFVTSFLPGELQQVPDPCSTMPQATLNQYLPGKLKKAAPPLNSGTQTECTWTLDSAPAYRVLEVQMQAYSPSGLASGNGSATFAAADAFQTSEQGFTSPAAKTGQPKAVVTELSGMPGGTQTSAFQATQVFTRGGATTDVANVVLRYRNVIITVVVDGLDQSSGGKKYGPVSMSNLTAAANAAAKQMASQIAK